MRVNTSAGTLSGIPYPLFVSLPLSPTFSRSPFLVVDLFGGLMPNGELRVIYEKSTFRCGWPRAAPYSHYPFAERDLLRFSPFSSVTLPVFVNLSFSAADQMPYGSAGKMSLIFWSGIPDAQTYGAVMGLCWRFLAKPTSVPSVNPGMSHAEPFPCSHGKAPVPFRGHTRSHGLLRVHGQTSFVSD